jgi:hypothetical protein
MKTVLFVFPTLWDRRQLETCRGYGNFPHDVAFAGPDDFDCPWNFDALAFIEDVVRSYRESLAGVTSSSDYPGAAVAAAVAARRGLRGTPPGVLLTASNKLLARRRLAGVLPEANPTFALLDPDLPPERYPDLDYPCFVKPVKGSFSVLAGRVDGREALARFLQRPAVSDFRRQYVRIHDLLAAAYGVPGPSGGFFLAEGLLEGHQVTVEGVAAEGEVFTLGVVDSILDPATGSFVRFDYPSRLPGAVQDRLERTASEAARALGLENTLFNVELVHDPVRGRVGIIEVNVRLCGQFADLHEKVDGTNTYALALDVAAGRPPVFTRRAGAYPAAASVPLRVFRPARVERVPPPEEVRAVEAAFPGVRVWTECAQGEILEDFESLDDGHSARYGVINLGGRHAEDAASRAAAVIDALDFRLTPLPAPENVS